VGILARTKKEKIGDKKITLVINNIKVKYAEELMFYLKIIKKMDEKWLESARRLDAVESSEPVTTNTVSTVARLKKRLGFSCET